MNWLQDPIAPMLATLVEDIPQDDYSYEVKWDGIRALISIAGEEIRIRTRNQNEVTRQFPELKEAAAGIPADNVVLDGEIVCLDSEGRPSFKKVIKRTRTQNVSSIERLTKTHPVYCYLFDCLYLNGHAIVDEPLYRRQELLAELVTNEGPYRLSESFEDGDTLFQAARGQGLEGIMAKKRTSRYLVGRRSDSWKKIKVRKTANCLIIGYTQGEGGRSNYFGALHLAQRQKEEYIYRGKVGTGFSDERLKKMYSILADLQQTSRPSYAPYAPDTVWIEPKLRAEVSYNELTSAGIFRAPVFVKLK